MRNLELRLKAEPLRSLAFGSIMNTFMGIGSHIDNPVRIFKIQNLTDQTLEYSFDGVDAHDILPECAFTLLDVTTNRSGESAGYYISVGTRVYARHTGTPPTSGAIYVSIWYSTR